MLLRSKPRMRLAMKAPERIIVALPIRAFWSIPVSCEDCAAGGSRFSARPGRAAGLCCMTGGSTGASRGDASISGRANEGDISTGGCPIFGSCAGGYDPPCGGDGGDGRTIFDGCLLLRARMPDRDGGLAFMRR